jgi:hypothetical protein
MVEEGAAEGVDVAGSKAGLKVAGVVVCAEVVRCGIVVAIANATTIAITAAPTIAVESARRVQDEREEGCRALIKRREQYSLGRD